MTAPALKNTFQLVQDALSDPESATAARAAHLLAMLVENLEAKELLDRSEINEMIIKLG